MAVVSENKTENMEIANPHFEIVKFTTAAAGDYKDSDKFGQVEAAFAGQQSADGNEIQLSFATQTQGQQRVTITPTTAATTGWLLIIGRK